MKGMTMHSKSTPLILLWGIASSATAIALPV